jgi:hypothetical protein
MTAGVESADMVAWATGLLSADSAFTIACPGGVHLGIAPSLTVAPICTLWVQSAPELLTAFGVHIWTDGTLMVKLTGPQDDFVAIRTAAARAYTLINRKTGAAQGSTIISCLFKQGFPLPEKTLVNGVQWISYVQLYQVLVQ